MGDCLCPEHRAVHPRKTKKGEVFDVRYRDERGLPKSKTFTNRKATDAFDGQVRAAKYNGTAMPDRQERGDKPLSLDDFVAIYWEEFAYVQVAMWMGHGPDVLHQTYSHVIAEFEGTEQIDADGEIRRARAMCDRSAMDGAMSTEKAA